MTNWERDDGYAHEETGRLGDFAAVICPPEHGDDGRWSVQVFDEANDDAMEYGEVFAAAHGIPTRGAAVRVAEAYLEELDAWRADQNL